jgi:hypothetical protein
MPCRSAMLWGHHLVPPVVLDQGGLSGDGQWDAGSYIVAAEGDGVSPAGAPCDAASRPGIRGHARVNARAARLPRKRRSRNEAPPSPT